jgi:L-asparagine transporter-like permease
MNWFVMIVGALLEISAIVIVIRMWLRKRGRWVGRLFWTILLLIPVVGLLFYKFLTLNPEARADHTEMSWG